MFSIYDLGKTLEEICTDREKREKATIEQLLQLSEWLKYKEEYVDLLSEINNTLISKIKKLDDPQQIKPLLLLNQLEKCPFRAAVLESFKNLTDENLTILMDYYFPAPWNLVNHQEILVKKCILSCLSQINNLNFLSKLYFQWRDSDCQSDIINRIENSINKIDDTSILNIAKLLSKLENGNKSIYLALIAKIKDTKDLTLLLQLYISCQRPIRLVLSKIIETRLNNKILNSLSIEDLQLISLNAIQDNNSMLLSAIDFILFPKVEKLTNPGELQNMFFFNDRNILLKTVILETLERLVVTNENYSNWNHQRNNHKINTILDRKTQQYIDCLSLDTDVKWKDLYDQSNLKNKQYIRELLKKRGMTDIEKKQFFANNTHSKGAIFEVASKNHPITLFNKDLIKAYKESLLTNNLNDQETLESIILDRMTK